MAMLRGVSGLGVDSSGFRSDEEIAACLLAGMPRETCGMPAYCQGISLNPASWFAGWLPQCQPYTQAELNAQTASQAQQACAKAADPVACREGLEYAAAQAQAAAERSEMARAAAVGETSSTCEYKALQEYPTWSRIVSPETICKMQAGEYNLYLLLGAAALVTVLMMRSGR